MKNLLLLLHIKYLQFLEHREKEGFLSALRLSLYKKEELVPVVRDLGALGPPGDALKNAGLQVEEFGPRDVGWTNAVFPLPSRNKRAFRYLNMGYRAFVLRRGDRIIGDLWYVPQGSSVRHRHMDWFHFDSCPEAVYMFDMHVQENERGKSVTTHFLRCVLNKLKEKGVEKAYGCFVADNVPALWVHRVVGYEELPRVLSKRFFLFETARAKT